MTDQINTPNKIVDLMKQKYGLTHISKTITVTSNDTLYTLYRKTARYLYKNGVENGDYTDKDEVLALSHKLDIKKNEIKKVDSSKLAPEEKIEFEKKFKFKNTQKDKWEDHIYQYQKDGEKTFIFIKPNGSIPSTYYGQRRYWTDTNETIKQRASLNTYYNGLPDTDTTPWITRANNRNEKVYFTAYSRDLLIGYDKLNIDLKRNFKEKSLEPLNELIDNLTDPKNSGSSNEYLFSPDAYYEIFAKQAHMPTYEEWKNAPEESLLKIRINKEDTEKNQKPKSAIEKELSEYLINKDQIIPKTTVSNVLSKNQTLNFVNRYLKDTYNLTLQQQYDAEQARSSHATFFQTKKNIDKTTQTEMERLTNDLSKHFKKVEIDNDVDLEELKKFIPELKQTVSALPHAKNGIKPILRFRKLKNHRALGMFTPINNTLAVDFRYDKKTKETGLQSFVHEYGHFLDYNYNGRSNLPLSINKNFSDSLQSIQAEIGNSSTALTPKESTYLKTPSEVFARAFETYASNLGLNNSVIKDKEIYNSKIDIKYSTFTPDIKKKISSYFDKQFPTIKQKIRQLSQENEKVVENEKPKIYRYYSLFRPINPGTYPMKNFKPLKVENFDERKDVGGNVKAWGYVEYLNKLSLEEQQNYDLINETPIKVAQAIQELNQKKRLNLTDVSVNSSNPSQVEYTVWGNAESANKHKGLFATLNINTKEIDDTNESSIIKNTQKTLLSQQNALSKSKFYDSKFIVAIKSNINKLQNIPDQQSRTQKEKGLSKAEMHRQAFLISRGRMQPTQDSKTMELSQKFKEKWATRRGEINKKQLARKHAMQSRNLER